MLSGDEGECGVKVTSLRQVVEYQLCCGCGLCAYLDSENIVMADVPAFGRRPRFTEAGGHSRNGQLALNQCPGRAMSRASEIWQRQGVIGSLVREWGPILDIWEGYAADPEIRFNGSSGGVLSAISLYCLEHEGMHGVLHTAADKITPYLNKTVMSRTRGQILDAAGSRYSPASPCEGLHQVESAPAPCVFIGKPCDVAALQNVRRLKPDLDVKAGLVMACFCAGTPSTNGTLEMLRQMDVDSPGDLISLRYRGCGWPGKTTAVKTAGPGPACRELTYRQSWGDILQKYRQWRCYICADHTGESADISTGDPWYRAIEEGADGQSLILARTLKGQRIIERAISTGYLVAEKADAGLLPSSQKNLLKARARLWGQMAALKLLRAPRPAYQGFQCFSSWRTHLTYREKVQSILGTVRRIYSKNIKQRIALPLR
ncbi:MAG: hypothetical protein VR65_11635 [Desulfobulbaceae bacterium BRH_c16a]|nr:MAG: hypothetical protein VR65_11635 [Desulfobulbaceae bacterium BRH_c16a]